MPGQYTRRENRAIVRNFYDTLPVHFTGKNLKIPQCLIDIYQSVFTRISEYPKK